MIALSPARRRARTAEAFIEGYEFPRSVRNRFDHETTEIEWAPVERGLREWLICCAYKRARRPLGMPSRAVDYAWHAFILDTAEYRAFCERAYGRFLDHIPDTAMPSKESRANVETVWAWDRSRASRENESVLWGLDEELDLDDGLGLSPKELARARSIGASVTHGPWIGAEIGTSGGCASGGCGGGCGGGGGGG